MYKILFLDHRSLSKNIKQTAVINIVRLRILIELNVSYAQQHTFSKVTVTNFKNSALEPRLGITETEGLDAACVRKNDLEFDERVEVVNT